MKFIFVCLLLFVGCKFSVKNPVSEENQKMSIDSLLFYEEINIADHLCDLLAYKHKNFYSLNFNKSISFHVKSQTCTSETLTEGNITVQITPKLKYVSNATLPYFTNAETDQGELMQDICTEIRTSPAPHRSIFVGYNTIMQYFFSSLSDGGVQLKIIKSVENQETEQYLIRFAGDTVIPRFVGIEYQMSKSGQCPTNSVNSSDYLEWKFVQ